MEPSVLTKRRAPCRDFSILLLTKEICFFLTPPIFYHSIKFHCFGELHVGFSQRVFSLSYNNFTLAESSWYNKFRQCIQLVIMFIYGYIMDHNIKIGKIGGSNFTFFFLGTLCQNSIFIYSLFKTVHIFK